MMDRYYRLPYYGVLALLVYMPFHIFISQWLSTFTGGLEVWKIWKDILLFLLVIVTFGLVYYKNKFKNRLFWLLSALSVAYVAVHLLVWSITADLANGPALLATVYNSRLFGYLIVGLGAGILLKNKLDLKKIFKIVISISTIVCVLGLLQWVLPQDVMTHFGYGEDRGTRAAFYIDDDPQFFRVISSIRDPNSLGTFLILPVTLLSFALVKFWRTNKRTFLGGLLLLHLLILFLSFSRSALGGAILSVGLLLLFTNNQKIFSFISRYKYLLGVGVILLSLSAFTLRDNDVLQNYVFHSDENSIAAEDSNEQHISKPIEGIKAVAEKPVGYGPGTAGWVSLHTKENQTENYFVQIAYEVGVVGVAIFIGLLGLIVKNLWHKRKNAYSAILLASFFGIALVNMVSSIWVNEAVSAQWFILAGLVIGFNANRRGRI